MDWIGLRAFAFAGIGRPEKFFATLRGLGADVVATHAFADHAAYDPRLLARLARDARAADAQLVTTEKDAVRLPPAFRAQVLVVPVRLEIADPAPLTPASPPSASSPAPPSPRRRAPWPGRTPAGPRCRSA